MALRKTFHYRNLWLGLAMLWIIVFHSGFYIHHPIYRYIQKFGYGGVDICLFASGIGCYFSLEKNPDSLVFLKRRLRRLGPTYLCFIIPWILWKCFVSPLPAPAILGNLLGVQTFVSWKYHFNWYIGGLILFYLCIPYLKKITDSYSRPRQDLLAILFLFLISVPFWTQKGNTIVIMSRLPILYTGLVCGKLAKQEYTLKKTDYLILAVTMLIGGVSLPLFDKYLNSYLWQYGLYWYPFLLITPGFCILLSALALKLERFPIAKKVLHPIEIVGIYSFEVYLVHVFLYEGFIPEIQPYIQSIPKNPFWVMTLPVIAAGSFLLNRLAAALVKLCTRQKTA